MSARPESARLARRWAEKAEEDLRTAEHMLTLRRGCPFAVVCFHSQQCAEKYLKALLTLHSVEFPKTHDMVELLRLVPGGAGPGLALSEVSVLNRYSIEARYPGDWEPFTRSDAEEAVAIARKVRRAVRARLTRAGR